MAIMIPINVGDLNTNRKTLQQALSQASNHPKKDFSETQTTVWLPNPHTGQQPHDEWKRVQEMRKGL